MKIVIIGAGATAHSRWANPDRRPPLLNKKDFLRMFTDAATRIPAVGSHYYPFFHQAIELFDGDIEALFTGVYILENPDLFTWSELENHYILQLQELAKITGKAEHRVTFTNLITKFAGLLRDEIQLCIGTEGRFPTMPSYAPVCPWHRKIASQLSADDVVVNFNYDLIMPFALLKERKLSRKSFHNPYIREVDIPQELSSDAPVTLITPHGSFTWWAKLSLSNDVGKDNMVCTSEDFIEICREVMSYTGKKLPLSKQIAINNKINPPLIKVSVNPYPPRENYYQFNIILPLSKKRQILEILPYYYKEYQLFLKKLEEADEIFLIGKQFMTADKDIVNDIKRVCSNSKLKQVTYVDPSSESLKWEKHHNDIFNASTHEKYASLEAYVS